MGGTGQGVSLARGCPANTIFHGQASLRPWHPIPGVIKIYNFWNFKRSMNLFLLLDVQVFIAELLETFVIPGAAKWRPGIHEDRRSSWIPVFTGMTEKT